MAAHTLNTFSKRHAAVYRLRAADQGFMEPQTGRESDESMYLHVA